MKPDPMKVVAGFLSEKSSETGKDLLKELYEILKHGLDPRARDAADNLQKLKAVLSLIYKKFVGLNPQLKKLVPAAVVQLLELFAKHKDSELEELAMMLKNDERSLKQLRDLDPGAGLKNTFWYD
jgi:hypothetical protein